MMEPTKTEPTRGCENCGNYRCANSIVAYWWDECVKSDFTKHWMPLLLTPFCDNCGADMREDDDDETD